MTHLHLSTLGQCLISLARQGIKEPLYRVLRFVESGAVVPKNMTTTTQSEDDFIFVQDKNKKDKSPLSSKPIITNKVKVSFEKASNILDQINEIQQQPDIKPPQVELNVSCNIYPPNYSTEEQCADIQKIVDFQSPVEVYINQQLIQMNEHLEIIKSHDINQDYLHQVEEEVQFLQFANQLCNHDYLTIHQQGQVEEFIRLQEEIANNVSNLSEPNKVLQLMKEFNLSYYESDKCFQLHSQDLDKSSSFLRKMFYTPPKSFFKIDEMD